MVEIILIITDIELIDESPCPLKRMYPHTTLIFESRHREFLLPDKDQIGLKIS